MSDLLNQASLVMVPSGYKEDTVYSVVPSDGSGDLSFTRASNGTRVNSAGLVEVVPWNLADQSNTFGTSPWSTILDTGATLTYTANYGTAPDGTTTAGRLQMALNGSNYAQKNQIISVITGQQYTYSVWIKSLSGTKDVVFCYDNTNNIHASVTTEWQRFTHTFTGNSQVYARFVLEAGTSTSVDLLIYGAQLNIGSTAKPYFPTTDRLNVPRLTYQNGGGGCPSLLLEKQSTNLQKYSEQFDQTSAWGIGSGAISANQTISPDGTQNADLFNSTSIVGGQINNNPSPISITSGVAYTFSLFIKNNTFATGEYIQFNTTDNITSELIARINPFDKTITNLSGTGSPAWSSLSSSVVDFGNGWSRYIITATAANNSGAAVTYLTSNNAKNCYIWGFQSEASSYPTSYIPTTNSSATRVEDVIGVKSLSSVGITSNYTLFFQLGECNLSAASSWILQGSSGANTPFQIYGTTAILYTSTGYIYPFSFSSYNPNNSKVAVSYNGTNIKVFLDGVKVGQWTSTSEWANLNDLYLTYNPHQQLQYKQVVLFNVGLSDADGIALTTL